MLDVTMVVEQCWQPVPGGSGTYVVELTRALAARDDVEVRGLAAWHRGEPPSDVRPELAVVHAPLPRRALYDAWNRTGLLRVEHLVRPAPDVVHAPTWAVPRSSRPVVVTVHDLAFLRDPSHFTERGVRYFRRSLQRVRDEAALVLVPSEATAQDCVAAGIEAERVVTIPHGVRVARSSPADVEAFRRRTHLDRPYVLWTGTREPRKNLGALVTAFDALSPRLPDVDLVLVGPDGWGAVPVPTASARVRFLGRLSWEDLQHAYAGAAAFCYPSIWEGFGMPVLEAMAHGVPVVTSSGTSTAEVGGDAVLAVDPDDTDAIAAALKAALGARGRDLAQRGLDRAALFTWSEAASRTVDAYRSVSR
ncbi:glycosyltransferase family 1 protein [Actinotalea sp. Marseille-Q4924]|uniref:glycosyltransferase family 4 protein n=1 Tax=Actinotalea sp. Marseille-Q4924 TaxID=2866571 RepID=UPI001CE40B48|nr:glycosyltransferase family 1 protein [Actinotalea sp. Marseille-Q4924]